MLVFQFSLIILLKERFSSGSMNSSGQMEHSEGQCYKPGVLWGPRASSGGGAGSGMASSKGGFGKPWGSPVTVITALGRGSKCPAPDGFLNALLQHLPQWPSPAGMAAPFLLTSLSPQCNMNPHTVTF